MNTDPSEGPDAEEPREHPSGSEPGGPAAPAQTPVPRLLSNAALVFLGGAIGCLARAALVAMFPASAESWTVFGINILGSFLFALLTAATLSRRDRIRALVGTGMLGGFTTYSALAIEVGVRSAMGDPFGIVLGLASIVCGPLLALLGWRIGDALARGGSSSEAAA
ncbi:CrcB family protein [Gulosibacter sp. 10]|uniref:fluoride efflux transporter FluC n=1 Tax=Gulosibacter sp. 10 TaxID=1255570 RepID=UPI00097F3AD3|nr:CrcB family protein [Gulosibacter sp. 10]SJM64287.1 CrcB protein [Gulosibacter sp. 10]